MKLNTILKTIVCATLSIAAVNTASADKAAQRKVFTEKQGAVHGIKGILKLNITFNGQTQEQEAPIWGNATCIDNGLLVAAYATLNPQVPKRPGLEVTKDLAELKIINAAGEEFDAKLILHDEDLGLAYIALDPKGENAKAWKSEVVDISKDAKVDYLQDVISIARQNADLRYQAMVRVGYISTIVKKPRTYYQIVGANVSAPSFSETGEFIGLTVAKSTPKGQSIPVVLPAKSVRKLLDQAKAKQAELAK